MHRVFTQVINLDKSAARLARMQEQLAREGIDFERVPAVNGHDLSGADLKHAYSPWRAWLFHGRVLGAGEIGCCLSHEFAIRIFLQSEAEWGLIMEDDCVIPEGFSSMMTGLLDALSENACRNTQVVNLGKAPKPGWYTQTIGEIDGHELVRAHFFPKTAHALLWTRKEAEAFDAASGRVYTTFDQRTQDEISGTGCGYALDPPLVHQRGLDSDIASLSAEQLSKKVTRWYRLRFKMRRASTHRKAKRSIARDA